MKVEQIGDFRTVSLNDLGGTKVVALSHMGEVETTMTLDDAKQVADQIMAWDIESAYNLKDEEGNPVPDEIVEGSRD